MCYFLISYNKDFAYNLINQFEQLGSFELVSNHIGKDGILGNDRIIDYVKKFFKEADLVEVYGENAYIHWYSNNKLIHIGRDLQSSKIPFKILKIIICNIYEVLITKNFSVSNEFLINHLIDFFNTTELFKFYDTEIPNILKFGRISYLLHTAPVKTIPVNTSYDYDPRLVIPLCAVVAQDGKIKAMNEKNRKELQLKFKNERTHQTTERDPRLHSNIHP